MSIVLMAGVDAAYKFTFVDIGAKGRFSDSNVFRQSNFGKKFMAGEVELPDPKPLQEGGNPVPYVFVGDETFPLTQNLMRLFPDGSRSKDSISRRIFNYRLSRARQQVECAFGILAARFRVYRRPFEQPPHTVELITQCTTVLHNYLRHCTQYEEEIGYLNGTDFMEATDEFFDVGPSRIRATRAAEKIRDDFLHYFHSTGSVDWQMTAIQRGKY